LPCGEIGGNFMKISKKIFIASLMFSATAIGSTQVKAE
jgi:hypothetical protein